VSPPADARLRSDAGVVIVLVAVAMMGLVTVAAIVIDFGQVRAQQRASQGVADLAALDAGFFLSGRGSTAIEANPRAACWAALNSVKTNSDFPSDATYPCDSFPETFDDQGCDAGDPGPVVAGDYELSIVYPVPDGDIVDANYGGPGVKDGEACQRIHVDFSRRVNTAFAHFIGDEWKTVTAEATARGTVEVDPHATPAFLILERTACNALTNSVGGSSQGIIVRAPVGGDDDMPGLLHIDSSATGSNCSGSSYALMAGSLPDGTPSVKVYDAPDGSPGLITIYALRSGNAARAFHQYPQGISHEPTAGRGWARGPMDDNYNPPGAPAISELHTTARQAVMATGSPGPDFTTVSTCSGTVSNPATKIYVDCASIGGIVDFPNATEVVFRGSVSIGNNQSLTLPAATRVVVRGQLAAPQGAIVMRAVQRLYVRNGIDTSPSGTLAINSTRPDKRLGEENEADCVGGLSNEVRVAIFGGTNSSKALSLGGNAALCATAVYIAGPTTQTAYQRHSTISGGNCSPTLPCPASTTVHLHSTVNLAGHPSQQRRVIWFAPNNVNGPVEPGQQGVEDLALWMETSDTFSVGNNAVLEGSGVFFAPNAHTNMASPTSATPRAAQFITRTLNLSQGTLELRPVATDSIQIPMAGGYGLIR
jgi:hypothetical protein